MSDTVLYIDDVAVDLGKDTVIGITKQVNNIAELKDRQADYSTQFKLPATRTNREIINGANIFQSSTRTQYRRLPARLIQNGAETLGYLVISSASDDSFESVFYSGNLNFFSVIQGKKLTDLDLSSAEHAWTCPNVFASRLHQWNVGGYIYPVVDTVNDGIEFNYVDTEIDFRWLTPWLFVKFIFAKIFEEAGFTFEGAFLSSHRFENLITPLVTNKERIISPIGSGYEIAATAYSWPDDDIDKDYGYIKFSTTVTDPLLQNQMFTHSGVDSPTRGFRPAVSGTFSFDLFLDINVPELFIDRVEIQIHDATVGSEAFLRTVTTYTPGNSLSVINAVVHVNDIALTTDEVVIAKIFISDDYPLSGGSVVPNLVNFNAGTRLLLTQSEREVMLPGDIFKIQGNLYDMTQTDFIKGIMQRFCLTCDTDPYLNRVRFYQFSEVINNIPNARDWSHKIAQSSKVTFRDNAYAQKSMMRWEQSPEYPEITEWGDSSFNIDDEVLELQKDVLSLQFISSKRVIRLYGRYIPCVVFHDVENPEFGKWTENPGPRMLILDRESATTPITLLDPFFSTPQTFVTDIPMAYFKHDTLNDLTWEDGIETDYADLIRVLQLYKKTTEQFYLKSTDVHSFDFSIPVYIEKYASYFYVNKISNFVEGKVTTVELIKLN